MKVSIKENKVRGKTKWVVDMLHNGKRKRKFFNSYAEAKTFNPLEWFSEIKKKEPVGEETLLYIAKDLYYQDYLNNNYNPSKPKQKGYRTTVERVNKFTAWFGEGRAVHEVKVEDYKRYIDSGRWAEETKAGYSRAVRTFMAWCAKQNLGGKVTDWYSQTNPDLKLTKKKTYFKLPEIVTPEQAEGLLNEITDKYRPALALMLFAGIRPEIEMLTLDYSRIRWGKSIGLKAELTKTGRERWIKPPENLWSWLPKKPINIMPSYNAVNKARYRAAKRLGFDYPPNGARHSFASYGYWHLGFESSLDIMGHMSSETFLRNYKNNRVDAELASSYFSIKPRKKS